MYNNNNNVSLQYFSAQNVTIRFAIGGLGATRALGIPPPAGSAGGVLPDAGGRGPPRTTPTSPAFELEEELL